MNLLILDYELLLKAKVKTLGDLIQNGYATHSTKKEFRIYSEILGDFRKVANAHLGRVTGAKGEV